MCLVRSETNGVNWAWDGKGTKHVVIQAYMKHCLFDLLPWWAANRAVGRCVAATFWYVRNLGEGLVGPRTTEAPL